MSKTPNNKMILRELREIKAMLIKQNAAGQVPSSAREGLEPNGKCQTNSALAAPATFRDIAQGLLELIMELEAGTEWQMEVDFQRFVKQAAKVKLMLDNLKESK